MLPSEHCRYDYTTYALLRLCQATLQCRMLVCLLRKHAVYPSNKTEWCTNLVQPLEPAPRTFWACAATHQLSPCSALQASSNSTGKQQCLQDLQQLHADLPYLFLGFDIVHKSVKGLNGLDSCVSSLAPSRESSVLFSPAPSRPSSAGSSSDEHDIAAKLAVMSEFKSAFEALCEVSIMLPCAPPDSASCVPPRHDDIASSLA